tara:strand:- start:3099 stop:3869 length:771 start_codon:yes stop_codon:yes gene_type:complete
MKKSLYLLILVFLLSCSANEQKKTIILSKASANYVNWLTDPNFNIVNAYDCKNLDSLILLADGIVLTGGEDINPLMYGDSSNLLLCEAMDFRRDTIEKKLFDFALSEQIPFVGICRGMQMMNVAHGGTLYGDIPSELGDEVIHRNNGEVMHDILVKCYNLDYTKMIFPQTPPMTPPTCVVTDTVFTVNSWHHQGLKDIAEGILVIAESSDGLPEAVIMDKKIHPFMIAVQFHPERLGSDNGIHKNMRSNFFNAIYE